MAQYEYTIISQNLAIPLGRDNIISHLGITIDLELKFTNHINEKINKVYGVLGVIKRHFKHLTPETLVLLYKSMVRTHIEYRVWSLGMVSTQCYCYRVSGESTKKSHQTNSWF